MVSTVAIVQGRPHYLDLPRSLEKALGLIEAAAARGAKLIAFGETWLTGYPAWLDRCGGAALWDHAPTKEVFARLRASSVTVPGPATNALGALAAKLSVHAVPGRGSPATSRWVCVHRASTIFWENVSAPMTALQT